MSSAQLNSAGAVGSPTPSSTVTPRCCAAATSTLPLTLPVCEMSRKRGSRSISAAVMWVRSRISTKASCSAKHWAMASSFIGSVNTSTS